MPSDPVAGNKPSKTQPIDDYRLLGAEIRASLAYADALVEPAILTSSERDTVSAALNQILAEFEQGKFDPVDQDLFYAVRKRTEEISREAGSKFNATRTRSEQIAGAIRLWLLEEMESLGETIAELQRALLHQAEGHVATLMPGYIDAKPAQVISCSHWLLSYFWMLTRDQERLNGVIGRTSISPLGSGLMAGTIHRIDQHALAQAAGFSGQSENSIDAVSDMDFAAEFLFFATMVGLHLSRLAEDLLLYSRLEFLTIGSQFLTAMPQPPSNEGKITIESTRSQSGRLLGDMTGFLSTIKGLPTVYSQDSINSRQVLFNGVDLLRVVVKTLQEATESLTVHPDRMYDALDERILASDLIDYLVSRNVTYPDAYQIITDLYENSEQSNTPIAEMELADLQEKSAAFAADFFALFDYSRSVAQRAMIGGTAPASVRTQIRQAFNWLMEAGLE